MTTKGSKEQFLEPWDGIATLFLVCRCAFNSLKRMKATRVLCGTRKQTQRTEWSQTAQYWEKKHNCNHTNSQNKDISYS